MSMMIFSTAVVCLEWKDSMALGLNSAPNQNYHNTVLHEPTDPERPNG